MRTAAIITGLALTLVIVASASAQCVKHAEGNTALIFDNVSGYSVTFYVDDVRMVTLQAHAISSEFAVAPGPHVLGAMAPGIFGDLWVFAENDIPEGYVCTWHVAESLSDDEVKGLRGY